jgi:thiamine biosynthesis lipoprotein
VTEVRDTFACFGGECTVIVDDGLGGEPEAASAVASAKRSLLEWHGRFTRFEPGSELSQLNADPRAQVPVSPLLRRIVDVAVRAACETGGLVDPTLVDEIEAAGYDRDLSELAGPGARAGVAPGAVDSPLARALALAPPRAPGAPDPSARYLELQADRRTSSVTRPPGVKLDAGGIAKGVFADELAAMIASHGAFVVDCCGDLRLGGRAGAVREVKVESPFDGDLGAACVRGCRGRVRHQRDREACLA